MRISQTKAALAAAALACSFSLSQSGVALAAGNCEITKCRYGGNVSTCWNSMKKEAATKLKSCNQIVVGSGQSAYAMALTLPRTCIKPNAVIQIHRPYHKNYKAVAAGSRWHNFYFGRIRPSAVSYFKARGGMKRDGFANVIGMVSVPASKTGLPLCKRI
jgi:hypothetical protein